MLLFGGGRVGMILVASSPSDPFNQDLIHHLGGLGQPCPLPYGDAVFMGVWEDGEVVRVLIERKKLIDMIRCVMDTGRHIQQMRDAHGAGYKVQYLILEGMIRAGADGRVETRDGSGWVPMSKISERVGGVVPDIEFGRLDNYLNQLALYLGVFTKETTGVRDTARRVLDLYYLFQKPPDDHSSLRMLHNVRMPTPGSYSEALVEPSLVRKVANQLPGVGWKRSRGFEEKYGNLGEMCRDIAEGNVGGLMKVKGIGKGIAEKIVKESTQCV